ncbi:MAG: outer membrane homotrimeric porin [Desulfovibrio sp.]|uniref:outer membrane homotrimeric porin n=1 Tax=Desulfovibrio sp. TaxID=885 RepID=UPI001A744D59|nr:outer membrane homotrimeric porin [Desulfovibrio sp.]MBD5417490.1 outer membrane homotrimeric porin [Desulfovibrio sp.]
MKKLCTLLLAAGLVFGAATGASAIDFQAKGQWLMGFTAEDTNLIHKTRVGDKKSTNMESQFDAVQRVRLQLDAVASESLSGTVYFEIGNTNWGRADQGGALGADGKIIKLKRAYIDWMVPDTTLNVRMGIQGVTLPNAAGGSAIMDTDVAGITANYKVNDNVSITALWARPLNDNFDGNRWNGRQAGSTRAGYLDNLDLFSLMVPLTFDGFEVTPWAMLGMKGANSMEGIEDWQGRSSGDGEVFNTSDGNLPYSLYPYPGINDRMNIGGTSKGYGTLFWAGLPFTITAFDPLNIEVDLNYGYSEPMGRYDAIKMGAVKRSSTERQGWLAKALVEYKMDWGVPGIFGWYGSGDDGNPKNGSERMPSIVPMGTFTSFMGDGNYGWVWNDYALDYAGTWGIGLQLRDMTFVEDLTHTFRVAYWGGTNSTGMVKYMENSFAWVDGWGTGTSPYLTTNDGLLEFNLVNNYKMYENFDINLELGYIANFMDNDTWKKAGARDSSFQKQDAWKAQLVFAYSF